MGADPWPTWRWVVAILTTLVANLAGSLAIAFAALRYEFEPAAPLIVAIALVSICVTVAAWRFRGRLGARTVVLALVVASCIPAAFAYLHLAARWYRSRTERLVHERLGMTSGTWYWQFKSTRDPDPLDREADDRLLAMASSRQPGWARAVLVIARRQNMSCDPRVIDLPSTGEWTPNEYLLGGRTELTDAFYAYRNELKIRAIAEEARQRIVERCAPRKK